MANVRIKDITTTASVPNGDDYLAIDGATSGTRKVLAKDLQTETDTTLSVSGKAADAKATGDAIKAQNVEIDTTLSISGKAADAKVVGDNITNLKSALSMVTVSDNMIVNQAIPEMYISGADMSSVDNVSVNKSSGGYTFTFRSNGETLYSIVFPLTGDVRISAIGTSTIFAAAVFSDDFDDLMLAENQACTFNINKITNISANPVINDYFFLDNEVFVPTFTRTTSKRISTTGTIADASSAWFYSSPIQVQKGDVIKLRCGGTSSAAPLSITDSTGSSYTPCLVYTGTDPDDYTYVCHADGYVCISLPNSVSYFYYIIRDNDAENYVDANQGVANAGKVLTVGNDGFVIPAEIGTSDDGSQSIPIEAINHGFKRPTATVGADCTKTDGWSANGTTLTKAKKYNNITRQMLDCVKVESASGNGLAYYNLPQSVNANNYALLFEVCIGEYTDTNPPAGDVQIELYSGSYRTSTVKMTFKIQGNTRDSSYNPVYNRNGWFSACVIFPSLSGNMVTVGNSFDPTNVTAVGVHPYNSRSLTNTVYVARMDFVPIMQRPGICTIIDNFGVSVPAMADYAYSKGVRLNLSIIPGFYAGASGAPTCASKAELDRVAQQGHCIWNHTWTHPNMNTLTYPQIQDQVNLAETWMQINRYGDNKEFISNPSSKFNTATCNALLDSNAKMIFHKWVGSPTSVYIPYYPALRCIPTTILDQEMSGTMSGSDIADVAEKAMTYGGITFVGFHGTYWELDDGISWKAYIDDIAEISNVYHYGLDEIYNGQWC